MSFVPFATRVKSLEEFEFLIIQHFPPSNDDIKYQGIFHSNKDGRMPAERSWSNVLKCAVKILGRHGLNEDSATKFLMDKTMGTNIIPFDNVCTWYSNKDTRPSYDAFAKEARPLMTDIFKDLLQTCSNIKVAVIHGEEPYKVIVKNSGAVPLELIVNKTHNVVHGCRLSNNAYCSCEWIIYTDVVTEAVVILLDQDAIPLVTTEDRNEILLKPTWNSTEEKAARKRKRKDGKTAVKKSEEEAKRAAKAAKRGRKRAEKEAEEEAKRAAKKRTPIIDATIERMVGDGCTYTEIASELGNGLKHKDINDRWNKHVKRSSGIIKPPVPAGPKSSITWTVDDDAAIVRMRTDDISFAKIASKLGNGLTRNDIMNKLH